MCVCEDEVDRQGFHAVCFDAKLEGELQRSSYRKDVSQSSSSRASVPKFTAAEFHGSQKKNKQARLRWFHVARNTSVSSC